MRTYSHDVPSSGPTIRRLTVTANLGNGNYLVRESGQRPTLARANARTFAAGDSVIGRWSSTAGGYLLR